MKVVFVGGGTGGHFYPLIAVAEALRSVASEKKIVQPQLYYLGPSRYDEKALYENGIKFFYCPAKKFHKTRDFVSYIKNIFSLPIIFLSLIKALYTMYRIFPDVVFSKGGYTAFPVLWAAKVLRIPVVIHESDAVFGRVSKWSAGFAHRIGISYPEVDKEINEDQKEKTALVGIPIRRDLLRNVMKNAHEILSLSPSEKTILILGGSQGAATINEAILDVLPRLREKYQVIHQTGEKNFDSVKQVTGSLFRNAEELKAYHPIPFLSRYYLRAAYSVADLVISRSGSGTLAELAEWGIPTITLPIPTDVSHDQRSNAYAFARKTGATVIENENLTHTLLLASIQNILDNPTEYKELQKSMRSTDSSNAAQKIAEQIVAVLTSHQI